MLNAEKAKPKTGWILFLTSLGFFMSMMDSMIVTTASTAIRSDFSISVDQLQWALNAYNIAIAAVLLVGVAIGDRLGHRKVYELGLLIFVIGSILCALSGNIMSLIVARVVEGVGASVITPMSMAILTANVPVESRGKALGIWSGIGGLALIVGPALGGIIVAKIAWQWIFWINVPIGLICILLSQQKLPETKAGSQKINILDSLLVVLTSAGLIWALSASKSVKIPTVAIIVAVLSILFALLLVWRQKREDFPLIPLSFFQRWQFTGANLATALLYAAMYGVVFFLPQFFQVVGHVNAMVAGMEMLPWTGMLVLVAPFAGRAVDRFGEQLIAIFGLFLQGLGYLLIGLIVHDGYTYSLTIVPLGLAGIGLSMAGPALQKAVLGAVSPKNLGKASGLYNMFRLFGGAIGVTISVLIFYAIGSADTSLEFSRGFQAAMVGAGGLSLIGILSALRWRQNA
ncbi:MULTISPECIES: MFS transporter [Lacticaseibacillus]|uniref:MFS transporter n=2 Tax=Lacticaseibacillus TaxID=2759736 RepID=A0AAN1EZQ3_LACCA|nr:MULTISPECIES: MFS transporter [Lacticaseibacillus]ARY92082.1 MFS transporter [Lacticaseibacillus casei]KAB1971132.1 MFS transporter [Lacticaseibacillus casei]WLV79988.1 MFS transporter [Lacticaseibacillus sp. NCIMB 15473]WNX23948.1 MFS transporter [Lacticaseibacillus casei]WNX26722.1 MFS transporter [Lacticaseibacillus casei]